jgi:hypothetical protein
MLLNRRTFLVSASAIAAVRPSYTGASQATDFASGGIGLSLAEIQELYEELPVGQDYGSFVESETDTTLFIDFGEDDFARTIWVFGQLERDSLNSLVAQLCPNDAEIEHRFGMSAYAGAMAELNVDILRSESIEEIAGRRTKLMAKYTLLPGSPELARDLIISMQLAD